MAEQITSTLADPLARIVFVALAALLVALGCWAVGFALGRRGKAALRKQVEDAQARVGRLERQAKDRSRAKREPEDSAAEEGTMASLAMSLPHIVSQLNRSDLDMTTIPDLILNLADSIFKPGQALFYLAKTKPGSPVRELHLLAQRGLTQIPRELQTIPFGEGKIGWVAENRLDKLKSEWRTLWRGEEGRVDDNHPSLHTDIVGPMMHHSENGDNVLGVICLGQPETGTPRDKFMFQMVTNLGSLAVVNAMNVHRLRGQAHTDGLTGLHNKSYFMREVSARMLTASQQGETFSIFIFDIDHFKTYNDTNGHPAGDALLKKLSGLLKELNRQDDFLCRYGGEEFLIGMPNTSGSTALELAEKIRKAIAETHFEFQENQPSGNLTISGGVAAYPKDGQNLDELIRYADEALYEGKRGGRNSVNRYKTVQMGEPELEETETVSSW